MQELQACTIVPTSTVVAASTDQTQAAVSHRQERPIMEIKKLLCLVAVVAGATAFAAGDTTQPASANGQDATVARELREAAAARAEKGVGDTSKRTAEAIRVAAHKADDAVEHAAASGKDDAERAGQPARDALHRAEKAAEHAAQAAREVAARSGGEPSDAPGKAS